MSGRSLAPASAQGRRLNIGMVSAPFIGRMIAILAFAGLLAAAYPPVDASDAAWVALIPLLLLARFTSPRRSFSWGWWGGFIFWLLSLSWLLALARTGAPALLAVLGWLLLSAYCALYTGAFTLLVSAAWRGAGDGDAGAGPESRWRGLGVMLVAPCTWVGLEFLRATWFTGFSWNALGVSQCRNLPVIQVADWGGVYAVSAVVVLVNAALAVTGLQLSAGLRRQPVVRLHVELMLGLLVLALVWQYGLRALRRTPAFEGGPVVHVAAVQPCIPQLKKWPPEFAWEILQAVSNETERALLGEPDLIIWPETAIAGAVHEDPITEEFPRELAARGVPILAGLLEKGEVNGSAVYYNASFLAEPDGRMTQCYRKRHLVPFGEYLPLDKHLTFLQRIAPLGMSCWAGTTSTVFRLPGTEATFSTLICFEDTVAALARESVRHGAGILINQTNDAWFDGTPAAVQHLNQCVFRAVENRVPVVRSANSGVTGLIDPWGRVSWLANEDGRVAFPGFAAWPVRGRDPAAPLTVYTSRGDGMLGRPCGWLTAIACVVAAGREWALRRRTVRERNLL